MFFPNSNSVFTTSPGYWQKRHGEYLAKNMQTPTVWIPSFCDINIRVTRKCYLKSPNAQTFNQTEEKRSLQNVSREGKKKGRGAPLIFYLCGREHTRFRNQDTSGSLIHSPVPPAPRKLTPNKEINQGGRWQAARLLRRIHIHLGLLMSTAGTLAVQLWGTAGESEDAGDKQKDSSRGGQCSQTSSLSNSYRKEAQMEGKWWKRTAWTRWELMEGFQLLIAAEIQHWCYMELWSRPIFHWQPQKEGGFNRAVLALWVEWDTKYFLWIRHNPSENRGIQAWQNKQCL